MAGTASEAGGGGAVNDGGAWLDRDDDSEFSATEKKAAEELPWKKSSLHLRKRRKHRGGAANVCAARGKEIVSPHSRCEGHGAGEDRYDDCRNGGEYSIASNCFDRREFSKKGNY
ncbi:hypothetical protein SASPL_154006 [Salvia splendens]|uniref:Uncharacterized protein n=1 Tax=Salvia splendens TaxID=180675 RepID=A0A8X8VZE6_SALSN|nr:hypothetical protein SASPL_154006 [Salvia splendens]